MKNKENIIVKRVKKGNCPICNKLIKDNDDTILKDYNGINCICHQFHIKE